MTTNQQLPMDHLKKTHKAIEQSRSSLSDKDRERLIKLIDAHDESPPRDRWWDS
jgi:hypothetical protein